MWNTIANFRENLSQIASEVLDTAEELEVAGSEHGASDGLDDLRLRLRLQDPNFQAEEQRFQNGIRRLQRAETSMSANHALLMKEKEDELLKLQEENEILKKKLLNSTAERLPLPNGDVKKRLSFEESSERHGNALHEWDGKENDSQYPYNGHTGSLSRIKDLELQNKRLQVTEKELSSKLSEANLAYASLKDSHAKSLDEIGNLKEMLEKERAGLASTSSQLQRDRKAVEVANKESKRLKMEKQKMSLEIAELRQRLDEQTDKRNSDRDNVRAEILKEMEESLFLKNEKLEQLQTMVKDFEKENLLLQAEVQHLRQRHGHNQQAPGREDKHEENKLERKGSLEQTVTLKGVEGTFELERKDYEKQLDKMCAERDKAFRDLERLKQHLIEKEQADSEKMDQDSERIAELQERADASTLRAQELEKSLAHILANQMEENKKNDERLQKANEEISHLKKKLAGCMSALEAKDVELLNLQTALGQYYAEIEAKDRLHADISTARKELLLRLEDLKAANSTIEMKTREKEEVLGQLAVQEKLVSESQEKAHKLEADILMLRRALEQSLTQLNRMSSDSDYYVDRRIVIKLLVTYFQRHQSKEVLDLMARMLGFSEEDKQAIGFAQQGGGKGVVRGVLGFPGRVVGGLLRSGSSSSVPSVLQTENQSFADLWIDFLLKESEERERKQVISTEAKADDDGQKTSSSPGMQLGQESASILYSNTYTRGSDTPSRPNFIMEFGASTDRSFSASELGDPSGSEFSTIPLNSASSPSPVSSFRHSRTSHT